MPDVRFKLPKKVVKFLEKKLKEKYFRREWGLIDKKTYNLLYFFKNVAIYYAVKNRNIEITKLLLEYNANPNIENKNGWTLLHIASKNNSVDIVKLLIDAGADLYIKNKYGLTPLHIASKYDSIDVIKFLINYGIDINIKNEDAGLPSTLHLKTIL